MSDNKRRSVCLLIVNDKNHNKTVINELRDNFYMMDMSVCIFNNKTSKELKLEIDKIRNIHPSYVEEIIVVIHAPQQGVKHFYLKDGDLMNIHDDILLPLQNEKGFDNKLKLVIMSGMEVHIKLRQTDSNKITTEPYGSGKNMLIFSSENARFSTMLVSELVKKNGKVIDALKNEELKDLRYKVETTLNLAAVKIWKSKLLEN